MRDDDAERRSQVGIGTLAVFIAMVLVAVLAGGVLLETTGLLQGKSVETAQQSTSQVTDRVGVESATASYSAGNMQRIDIVLSKAPGSGDIDLSEMVVHWLGSNGTSELTDSTFSVTPIKGSGTVLTDRADRMNVSTFGKTIPDGTPATVRFITAEGGTTTVILRPPNAPPNNGDVSLLWKSPTGNPTSGSGTATATATPTATPTPTPSSPSLTQEWSASPNYGVDDLAVESGTSLYIASVVLNEDNHIREIDPADGSVLDTSPQTNYERLLAIDHNDEPVWESGGFVRRWNRTSDSIETPFTNYIAIADFEPHGGDYYLGSNEDQILSRYNEDGSTDWSDSDQRVNGVDTTSNAVYATWNDDLRKWDHNGNVQWSQIGEFSDHYDVAAGHSTYVFTIDAGALVYRVQKDGSSHTAIYAADNRDADLEVGPDDNLFVADGQDLHVLNADGSEILTENYGTSVDDVEVRSDGVYVDVGETLYKYTKSGF